jgi:uncharacterized FlaG/YvyC family protein
MDNMANNNQNEQKQGKLELIAVQKFAANSELYKIIDFLNRSLKKQNLLFGLSKDNEEMIISVYVVE